MQNFGILFLSLKGSPVLEFESANPNNQVLFMELVSIFSEIDTETNSIKTQALQKNNDNIQNKIIEIVDKYKEKAPLLNRLQQFFKSLDSDEFFYILPNIDLHIEETLCLYNHLKILNSGVDEELIYEKLNEVNQGYSSIFSDIWNAYQLYAPNSNKRSYIGESDKNKRICRFCKKGPSDNVTFNSVAHAIPEALGNKNIINYEECDSCNEGLANSIERDLINYLAIYRVYFGVRGKSGLPKIKFKNYNMIKSTSDGSHGMAILVHESLPSNTPPQKLVLETLEKVKAVNIYKALSKIALSIIDSSFLRYFDKTVEWINNRHYWKSEIIKIST